MNKIRTRSQLQLEMSDEFAWRKKELHSLKGLVDAHAEKHTRDLMIRAAVTLLYAHWEGFVRHVGRCYLEFVARQKLSHQELQPPFLALVIRSLVHGVSSNGRIQPCLDVVEFFRTKMPSRSSIKWESAFNTKVNLKSDVFREIVMLLNLDYSRFATKEKLIDEKLLANRNSIAHGKYCRVDLQEYMDLHTDMVHMMQVFYEQIDDAAFSAAYRRRP